MLIKIILILAIMAIAVIIVRSNQGARNLALQRIGMTGFVLLAVVAVLYPSVVSTVAKLVGVGRGTDLMLYILIIVFLSSLASNYKQHARLQREVTLLARELTLLQASSNSKATPKVDPIDHP